MRLALSDVEKLAPVPFVLVAGLIGGALQGAAEFIHNAALGALTGFLLVNGAALLLWWLSVRRRRHSVWSAACQIALAIGLAQIISFILVVPRVLPADVHLRWLDVWETGLVTQLWLTLIRFVEAAVLVAVGRFLPGSGRAHAAHAMAPTADAS